eukprot:m.88437 g.88437  ORF g.88437 m.88437 type:complete len:423 (-) comp15185_c0_seq1:143-1411(-)
MKLLSRHIEKDGSGQVSMIPEEAEDMWHAYNLIAPGDRLRATAIRKVKNETATGSSSSERVRTTLTLEVRKVHYDVSACMLRVEGRNVEENPFVKMGAHHTLDMELNRKFTLAKHEWDSVALDRVSEACDATARAELGAVVMQEGLAHVCLVTASMTLVRSRIDVGIARKRKGSAAQHDKAVQRFYDSIIDSILRHFKFDVVKCILVASPGFIRDQFLEYMFAKAVKTDNKMLLENRAKFVSCHASSGHMQSLREVLANPAVTARLANTKAAGEVAALEAFFNMLKTDPDRAYYGYRHVLHANELNAIDTLLLSDVLFRSHKLEERRKYVALVDSVKANAGTVRIFSSLHPSGEQLGQLSGIAAILRFPVPEPEGLLDDDNEPAVEDDGGEDSQGEAQDAEEEGLEEGAAGLSIHDDDDDEE